MRRHRLVRLVPLQPDLRLGHEGAVEDVHQQVGGEGGDGVVVVVVVTGWSDWSPCSQTCSLGMKERWRMFISS